MKTKKCSKCGIEKPLTAEYYHRKSVNSSVFRARCKVCVLEYLKNNKEKIIKRRAEYYQNNKEGIAEYQSEYRKNNKEKIAEYQSEYRKRNKEKIAKQKDEYRKSNKEKIVKRRAEYYQNNKEKIAKRRAEYYQNNKEKISKLNTQYYENNKEHISEYGAKYRAKKNAKQPACVYQILNKLNGKIYIGETMRGGLRWSAHLCELRSNRHRNYKIQEDYNKFGEEAFEWSIIKEVEKDKETLLLEEVKTIDSFLKQGKELYNLSLTVEQLKLLQEDT